LSKENLFRFIEERQERLLKRISKARGVSEAELIRQAIEREPVGGDPRRY
jgi:predicted DNA-binding protein